MKIADFDGSHLLFYGGIAIIALSGGLLAFIGIALLLVWKYGLEDEGK
jgi:hypothetical protein